MTRSIILIVFLSLLLGRIGDAVVLQRVEHALQLGAGCGGVFVGAFGIAP